MVIFFVVPLHSQQGLNMLHGKLPKTNSYFKQTNQKNNFKLQTMHYYE